jgi:hypothetical protein
MRTRRDIAGTSLLELASPRVQDYDGDDLPVTPWTVSITVRNRIGAMRIAPSDLHLPAGEQATIAVMQRANVPSAAAGADVQFDRSLLQIESVVPGPTYEGALLLAGHDGQSLQEAIGEANLTGRLRSLALLILPGTPVLSANEHVVVMLGVRATLGASGISSIRLSNAEMLDFEYQPLLAPAEDGEIAVGDPATPIPARTPARTPLPTSTSTSGAQPSRTYTPSPMPTEPAGGGAPNSGRPPARIRSVRVATASPVHSPRGAIEVPPTPVRSVLGSVAQPRAVRAPDTGNEGVQPVISSPLLIVAIGQLLAGLATLAVGGITLRH